MSKLLSLVELRAANPGARDQITGMIARGSIEPSGTGLYGENLYDPDLVAVAATVRAEERSVEKSGRYTTRAFTDRECREIITSAPPVGR